MTFFLRFLRGAIPAAFLGAAACAATPDLPALWAERVKCVVAVEYVTVTETERRPTVSMGTVIDSGGTIILQSVAIDPRAALWQLKEFKVYLPGEGDGKPAEYLGQDAFTGWHFVRAGKETRAQLTPLTAFAGSAGPRKPLIAEPVWASVSARRTRTLRRTSCAAPSPCCSRCPN